MQKETIEAKLDVDDQGNEYSATTCWKMQIADGVLDVLSASEIRVMNAYLYLTDSKTQVVDASDSLITLTASIGAAGYYAARKRLRELKLIRYVKLSPAGKAGIRIQAIQNPPIKELSLKRRAEKQERTEITSERLRETNEKNKGDKFAI